MAKILQYGGWIVAIMLLVICAILANRFVKTEATLLESQTQIVALQKQLEAMTISSESDGLEAKVEELERSLAESNEALKAASMAAAATPAQETPAEEAMDEAQGEENAEDTEDNGPSQRERMIQAQRGLMVDMVYKDLFQELNLSPELAAQMKAAIAASMGKQQDLVGSAMKGKDRTAKDVRADRDAMRAALRGKLADILTPQELAAYEDYELVADQILLEKAVEGQLSALASGLSPENRLLTSQVMAEELVREFDLFDQTDEVYSMDTFNAAQARGLQATLDRLASTLSEEQLGQVQGFVDQALTMFAAVSEGGGE